MKIRREDRLTRARVSQYQLGASSRVGVATGGATSSGIVKHVTVLTTAWADDDGSGSPVTPTYETAPDEGTVKYADLVHNLGSEEAAAVSFRDTTTGRIYTRFFAQAVISDSTLRVWLPVAPSHDIVIKVIA